MTDKYDFITAASQIQVVAEPDLPSKIVTLQKLKGPNGKPVKLLAKAITAGDYNDYVEDTRVYENGVFVGRNFKDDDLKLLFRCIRATNRSEIWKDVDEAVKQLRTWPRPMILLMNEAVNEVNGLQSDEVVEGNSEGVESESTPSDSAPTSESGTSTDS